MKQAVVILHGMGEQIPMQTLNSFVKSVWTKDADLVDPDKPDPDTGDPRNNHTGKGGNASWAKPDKRNNSTELRRITTERDKAGNYTHFFEYYWAHMMEGTTREHVQAWIKDLLLRDPRTRVPRRVLHAWIVLWIITLIVLGFTIWGLWPKTEAPKPSLAVISGLLGFAVSAFVSAVLIRRFGDVARYVKALPPNVAKRHAIRQGGVDLLVRLIDSKDYDRIVVVSHSLGTIVAYDILSMVFAHYNTVLNKAEPSEMLQPERHRLEEMIRTAVTEGVELDIDAFQDQQAKAFLEAKEQGSEWIISDFVTLGAPLTHAEFLIAECRDDLRTRQKMRLLPTCPPVLEYDGTTKLRHFTYAGHRDRKPEQRRVPHHAALFGYTRWTNLYSDERHLFTGDLISGPVGEAFGLKRKPAGDAVEEERTDDIVKGIRDIAVLPKLVDGAVAEGHKRSFFPHNNYWVFDRGTEMEKPDVPHHIAELRKALRILQ